MSADRRIREGVTRCFGPRKPGTISMLESAKLERLSARMRIVRRGKSPTMGAIDAEVFKDPLLLYQEEVRKNE